MVAGSVESIAAQIRRQRPAVVINTIGPFTTTAVPVATAYLPGSDYIDLANDVAAVLALLGLNGAAPAWVRVDMIPSLATEEGTIGEALAGTILDGPPGVEGGGRYAGRRYSGGRLTAARVGGDVAHLILPDGTQVSTASIPLGELVAAQRASGAPSVVAASSEVPSWGHARVEWADGTTAEGWLRAGEAQAFTGAVPAEIARRLLAGEGRPGAFTPAALFGPSLALACGGEYVIDDRAVETAEERLGCPRPAAEAWATQAAGRPRCW